MKFFLFFILIIFISKNILSKNIEILEETIGNGLEVVNHSKVKVHYIGKLENQTEFDNSYKRGEYFTFQVGTRQVIPGWETGLLGMKIGGKRTIFIPYELAYGENGAGELIPPKSNLIFEIELFDVIPPKYKSLDNYQFKLALTDEKFIILDIRPIEKIKQTGSIPGSIILTAFDNKGNFIQNFLNEYKEIVKEDDKVVFVSQEGTISSILANGFVEQLKQTNIYHLKNGVEGLKEINFKLEKFKN